MAISILQHTSIDANLVISFASPCTIGSTILVVSRTGGTASATGCSDPTNGSYAPAKIAQDQTTDAHELSAWIFQNQQGNTALTITMTNTGGSVRTAIVEVGGVATASLSGTPASTQQAATTAPATPSLTPPDAATIVFALCSTGNGSAFTENASGSNPATGWAVVEDVATGRLHVSSQIFSSAGAYHETWTIASSDVATGIIAFKAPGGAADTLQGSQQVFFM